MNNQEEKEARKKVEECKGSYDAYYLCDFCPLAHSVLQYDKESGEEYEAFVCARIWEI